MSQPQTILFVDFYEWFGGGQHSLLSILAGLDKKKYRAVLTVNQEGRLAKEARQLAVAVLIADMGRGRWRYFWKAIPAFLKMLKFAVDEGVVLVHSNGLKASKFGSAIAGILFVPSLWHKRIHVDKARSSSTARLWRFYSHFCDIVVAVSAAVKTDLLRIGLAADKVRVLQNFVSSEFFLKAKALTPSQRKKAGIPAGVPLVGMIGARRHHKGPDLFLRAAARLAALPGFWSKAHFVLLGAEVTGEEAFEKKLKKLEADFPWPKRLHVVGEQSNAAVWLKSFKLFVCPSRREGFGRVTVEAMLAGCPVVAAYPEAVEIIEDGKTGVLALADDTAALVKAMKAAMDSMPKARGRALAAKKSAMKRFGSKKYFEKLDHLYSDVLFV